MRDIVYKRIFPGHIHVLALHQTMQLVAVLLSCLLVATSAQEVVDNTGTQTATDGTTTQGIDWDSTARTASTARRGRYTTPRATPDYTTLFENQWGPAMMNQVSVQPYGTRLQSPGPREEMKDILEFFPFLRRPDLVTMNVTRSGDDYPQPDPLRQSRRPGPVPYHPGMFYPRPDVAEILRYTVEADPIVRPSSFEEGEEKQNISASSPAPFYVGGPTGRFENAPGQFPYPMFGYPPPDYFYRRGGDRGYAYPYAMPPLYYPPPQVLRNEDGSPIYPEGDALDRFIDREPGNEPAETVIPVKEDAPPVPVIPEPVNPILPPIVPRQPLPLPPFPFGLLPPGQAPFPVPPRFLPPTVPPQLPPPTLPPAAEEAVLTGALSGEPVTPPEVLPSNPPLPKEGEIPKPEGVLPPILPPREGVPEVRIPYEFGYDMNDGRGTDQHRQEISDGSGSVTGSYGYRDAHGVYRVVNYIADKNGFRAFIKSNEPGVANPGSADVVVMAEVPPPATIAEGLKQVRLEAVEVPDVPLDLVPEPTEIK